MIDANDGEERYSHDAGAAISAAAAWSPDGTHLAFVRGTFLGASEIVLADADGGATTLLGELEGTSVSPPLVWSRDGLDLLVAGFGVEDGELWLFSREGTDPVKLMSGVATLVGWR